MQLEGRVAAITGGTAGIGLAIAQAYLEQGAKVALMARNVDKGNAVIEELGVGERAIFVPGDAMVQADVEGFVDATIAQLGSVCLLYTSPSPRDATLSRMPSSA